MSTYDLDLTWIFATCSLSQALGRWIFNPSLKQDVKQDTEAMTVLLWTQIPGSESILSWEGEVTKADRT